MKNWDNHNGKKRKILGVYGFEKVPNGAMNRAFFVFKQMPDGSFSIIKDSSQDVPKRNLNHGEFYGWLERARKVCDEIESNQESHNPSSSLPPMPKVNARRPYDDDFPDGYLESLNCWYHNNEEAVEWFLENAERIRSILNQKPVS